MIGSGIPVWAQIQEGDTVRWQIVPSVSGRLNTGNIDRFIVTPDLNVTHIDRKEQFGFAFSQRYTYGTFGKFLTENDILSRNFFYFKPHRKVYPFVMVWINTHQLQQLELRQQYGLGLTVVPLKQANQLLKLSLTASYEKNEYKKGNLVRLFDTPSGQKEYETYRATVRVAGNHLFAQKVLNLFYEGYFQQALNRSENWRIFAEGGLMVKVVAGFSMKAFLSYEYQRVHLEGIKPFDLVHTFGITYAFRK